MTVVKNWICYLSNVTFFVNEGFEKGIYLYFEANRVPSKTGLSTHIVHKYTYSANSELHNE